MATGVLLLSYIAFVPNVSRLRKENPKKTSLMEYRESEWKRSGRRRGIYQIWVPLSRVSPYLRKAVVIAEDDRFFSHEGFDYEAIQKAIEKDIKARKFKAGGSTITQQLAKNLYLTPKKSPFRKLKEAMITWRLERNLSKRRILEIYLNVVEWGDGVFGIEAASRHYFGKYALELSPMEAARLVSVLPNPRRFNPAGDQPYVLKRSEMVYDIMVRRGIVIPEFDEEEETPPGEVKDNAAESAPSNIDSGQSKDMPASNQEPLPTQKTDAVSQPAQDPHAQPSP